MKGSIVSKLATLIVVGILVLATALLFLVRSGTQDMLATVSGVADTMLTEDIQNKNQGNQESAATYGKSMAQYLAFISASHLWNLQEDLLKEYAKGMLQLPNLAYAVVYDDSGKAVAGEKKDQGAKVQSFTYSVVYDSKTIGKVDVGLATAYLEAASQKNEQVKTDLIATFEKQAGAAQSSLVNRLGFTAVGIAVLLLVVSLLVLFRIAKPLRRMVRVVQDLGQGEGDLTVRVEVASNDEVGLLGASLNLFIETLAAMVRDFAEQVVAPQAYEADRTHTLNLDVVRQMGELGLFGLPFSEEYGGQGGDYMALGLAIEGLARVEQVTDSHLKRFAFREPDMTVDWRRGA